MFSVFAPLAFIVKCLYPLELTHHTFITKNGISFTLDYKHIYTMFMAMVSSPKVMHHCHNTVNQNETQLICQIVWCQPCSRQWSFCSYMLLQWNRGRLIHQQHPNSNASLMWFQLTNNHAWECVDHMIRMQILLNQLDRINQTSSYETTSQTIICK
jgi:hypothetical protein